MGSGIYQQDATQESGLLVTLLHAAAGREGKKAVCRVSQSIAAGEQMLNDRQVNIYVQACDLE